MSLCSLHRAFYFLVTIPLCGLWSRSWRVAWLVLFREEGVGQQQQQDCDIIWQSSERSDYIVFDKLKNPYFSFQNLRPVQSIFVRSKKALGIQIKCKCKWS